MLLIVFSQLYKKVVDLVYGEEGHKKKQQNWHFPNYGVSIIILRVYGFGFLVVYFQFYLENFLLKFIIFFNLSHPLLVLYQ